MEFTPALSAFQGVIISADSVNSFSKLKERGGNEQKIEYVINCLRNFLYKENYIVGNTISEDKILIMRKFAFYICINSNLSVLDGMVDLDGIDYIIWTIPTIPKYLMCEIFWKLNMEKFIYELIVFSCPLLALEVADAFLDSFKYFNPTECLYKLKWLSAACYRLICRLIFFQLKGDEIIAAFNNYQKCLKYFSDPPNIGRLERLSIDDQYKFIGNRLYIMLLLVSECLDHYTSVQKFKPPDFQDLYKLTYRNGSIINEHCSLNLSDCEDRSFVECIQNTNIALLDKCKNLVMDVSVEIFCAWSEFEENGKSMQQIIGELCFKVHTNICKIGSVSDHPVVCMLQQISCKPVDISEVINKTDATIIVENINRADNESAQWIKALIYNDNLCQNKILIEQIATHLDLLDEDECFKLFKIIYNFHKNNHENKDILKPLMIKVFQRCTSTVKHDIVDEHFSKETFNDSLQITIFNNMMTEIFNKLIISPEIDLSDVLIVFLQNPKQVYNKIFNLACENIQQTDIMLKVMKCLEKYCKHYYREETEPHIILASKEVIKNSLDTEDKQNNFIRFLKNLKLTEAIPGPKILLLIIMPNLHSSLMHKNIIHIYIQCKLLHDTYSLDELHAYRVPTLAMLGQVLDTVRWKMNTFVALAPPTLELVLQLQMGLVTHEISDRETAWLKCKLRNISPLNMYYFRHLWNPPGNTFVEVVSGMHIHKYMEIDHLSLWLSQTLSSTILQEWYQIWECLCTIFGIGKMFEIFHDALLLLCVAERSNHTECTRACLLYCMKNFVATTRYKFLKTPLSNCQVIPVFKKCAMIETIVEESVIEELATVFLPLFAYMAEKKEDLSIDLPIIVKKFKHRIFIDIIIKLFSKSSL